MKHVEPLWIDWSPDFAPHVKGRYTAREYDPATRQFEPQAVEMTCEHVDGKGERCGVHWRTSCASGRVREHIARFARLHLHRDPLAG